MKPTHRLRFQLRRTPAACALLAALCALTHNAMAQSTYDWTGTTNNNLSGTATNWSPSLTFPLVATDDILRWNAATYTGTTPTANAAMSFGQLLFDSGNTAGITFATGTSGPTGLSILTLNGVSGIGIQMNSGTGAVSTGSAKFALGASQSWINNDDSLLTVGGTITNADNTTAKILTIGGSGSTTLNQVISNNTGGAVTSITKEGAGTLTLGGNNSFTGDLLINNGIVATGGTTGRKLGGIGVGTGSVIADGSSSQVQINSTNGFGQSAVIETNRALVAKNGSTILTSGANVANRIGNVTLQGATMSINSTRGTDYGAFYLGTVNGGQQATVTVSGGTGGYVNTPSVINFTAGNGNLALHTDTQFDVADVTGDANADLTVSAKLILGTSNPNGTAGANSAGFTKKGAGTMVLTAANTYNGNTTVSAGTLALADNASIKFVLGATSGANNSISGAGTVTLDGDFVIDTALADGLTSGTWTLENVPSLAGAYGATFTVVGFTDAGGDKWTKNIAGSKTYTFDETTGILTLAAASGYDTWSGGALFDADANGDGVQNGLAFLLGAASPNANALGLLPTVTQSGGGLVLNFNMLNSDNRGTASLIVQHSSDLATWSAGAAVPTDGDGVTFSVTPGSPSDSVTATISNTQAAGGKLFGRLKATKP